jgi:hypothetical protein
MGVDYRVWLIPRQRSFRPASDQIAKLANALRKGKWVPMPDASGQSSKAVELLPGKTSTGDKPHRSEPLAPTAIEAGWIELHSQHEFVLEWWVNDAAQSNVQFPFTFVPYPESQHTYFGIRLMAGPEYFYWTGENVMPFGDSATQCECGEQLAYWTGFAAGVPSQRIHSQCPACGRAFDISEIEGEIMDCWTGERHPLLGGLAFRFALQVDCHKNFPHEEEAFRRFSLQDAFHELWRTHIAVPYDTLDTAD